MKAIAAVVAVLEIRPFLLESLVLIDRNSNVRDTSHKSSECHEIARNFRPPGNELLNYLFLPLIKSLGVRYTPKEGNAQCAEDHSGPCAKYLFASLFRGRRQTKERRQGRKNRSEDECKRALRVKGLIHTEDAVRLVSNLH